MSIASRITSIEGHIGDIYDSVELTGVDTTDIDKNLVNVPNTLKEGYIDIINNGTDTLYNNFPKVSGEGTSLTLNNTYQAPMRNNLKGNTSQTGTPTPTSPIPVNVVSGDNEINVVGKNLVSFANFTNISGTSSFGVTRTFDGETIILNGTTTGAGNIIPKLTTGIILKAGTYRGSITTSGSYNRPSGDVAFYLRKGNTISGIFNMSLVNMKTDGQYSSSFILTEDTEIFLEIYTNASNITFNNYICKFQIEKGSSASNYEPYQGNTYNIDLPEGMELCKIGNYQDYFYKDSDKWYLHKEIGKKVLNGTETWILQSTKTSGYNRFRVKIGDNLVNTSSSNVLPMYCNKLSVISPDGTFLRTQGIASDSNANHYFNVYIEDVSTYTLANFKTWLSSNNLEVHYILATPTTTEITDTTLINQLEGLYIAKSKENQTNISQINNDLPFIISASALKKG